MGPESMTGAVYTFAKSAGGYIYICIIPLFLVLLIKRVSWQHPVIQHFNRCIRNGTSFTEKDCHRVQLYLKEIENRFALLKGHVLTPLERAVPLNIAFKALPLLHKMAQENTCCALQAGQLPPFKRTFVCKQKIDEFLHRYAQDSELPLVAEEIKRISLISKKLEERRFSAQLKVLTCLIAFMISSYLMNRVMVYGMPAWWGNFAAYIGSLLAFSFSYDYYYSSKFNRYQTNLFSRFFKKKA